MRVGDASALGRRTAASDDDLLLRPRQPNTVTITAVTPTSEPITVTITVAADDDPTDEKNNKYVGTTITITVTVKAADGPEP